MVDELQLSDYEKGYLMAFSHQSYDDWCDTNREPEDIWYGVQVGDRVFDINLWRDEANDMVYCSAYECIKGLGEPNNYTTDSDRRFQLWEREDA